MEADDEVVGVNNRMVMMKMMIMMKMTMIIQMMLTS
jgi:hypothetical protein